MGGSAVAVTVAFFAATTAVSTAVAATALEGVGVEGRDVGVLPLLHVEHDNLLEVNIEGTCAWRIRALC